MNRLEAMQLFARVAELASFTRAAEDLGLPKARVSTAVQQLEAELGTRLLQRTTRKVTLTQDGQVCYERCRDLLTDMDEFQSMFRRSGAGLSGRLRVDLPTGVARHFVIPRLPEFLAQHPQLQLELSSTDRRVDVIREGFDCVLRVGALADSSLVARPLGWYAMVNCASPDYLKRHGRPKSLDDLARHRMIHWASSFGQPQDGFECHDGQSYRSLPVAGALTVNHSESYEAACLAGLGIIQAPRVGLEEHLRHKRLVEVLPQHRAAPMPVSLLYPHRRNLSPRVRAFMDWVAWVVIPHLQSTQEAAAA